MGDATLASSFEHIRSGDVLFMNRKCLAMKDPLGIALCLLTKTENRFDHVGMLLKVHEKDLEKYPEARKRIVEVSPSGTYVLETNMRGITLYAAEHRITRTSANELVSRSINVGDAPKERHTQEALLQTMESLYSTPYQDNVLHILPSIFSPPDKMDRITAAHKFNRLRIEADALTAMAARQPGSASVYRALIHKYKNAQEFLLATYFPHLKRCPTAAADPLSVDWSCGHFWIDGVNNAEKMVCAELICNLWQRVGLIKGFPPASSMRPFDLLDDTRFNFLNASSEFGEITPIKISDAYKAYWDGAAPQPGVLGRSCEAACGALTDEQRLAFANAVRTTSGLPQAETLLEVAASPELLPSRWVVQSVTRHDVVPNLWFRVFSSGVLFAACAVPCAPLTLRWMEGQLGLFLARGSVWSLTCGVFARNVAFAAVQAFFLAAAARWYDVSGSCAVMAPPRSRSGTAGIVDARHPYYDTVVLYAASAVVAHVCTTPLHNANIAHHFGPARPGPTPMRMLLRGSLALVPVSVLLPFQACWLSWYETVGSFIVPTLSSVWRPREDLLQSKEWPHLRNDALAGAFVATLAIDALFYPLGTVVVRRFVRDLYKPQLSPSFGRSLYAGYRHRLLSNLVILSASTSYLYGVGSL
ncbi:hypothetical protein ABB37_00761 [Leptomonas pyrrhocoris]|uniref:Uncharacterized protein n=1 Tax=Leptomonas pyrrhocoris TaxID=157538 RepID=A0A0M9GBB4_LEPPY|nr:hypothetical protein ABB37_00761 [Leptomonas pyrrhocoris]KPA86659.1 hypothetical protein ABB37_00761 [Leptomonas pyrrhocoris]|eukprot:XP_015665098.1 hypothetical protein ABB37_00761 [Leptomonas pyrrhocoris]